MPKAKTKGKHSRLRRTFRYCRITALLLVLSLVAAVIYLNQVGLPGFIRDPILSQLEQQGLHLEFSRLRWRWHQGVVADHVVFGRTDDPAGGPYFVADRAALRLDLADMARLNWRLDSLLVENGMFHWRTADTNLARQLQLTDIQTEVRFLPDRTLDVLRFDSRYKELALDIRGQLANPAALNRPASGTNEPPRDLAQLNNTLMRVANYLTNFNLQATPLLKLNFNADAADWNSLKADLRIALPQTSTSWGEFRDFDLLARVRADDADPSTSAGEILLSGREADTRWGRLQDWRMETRTIPVFQLPINSSNELAITFGRLDTRWGSVRDGSVRVSLNAREDARPEELDAVVKLEGRSFFSRWALADQIEFRYRGTLSRTNWLPIQGENEATLSGVQSEFGTARRVTWTARQTPPPPDRSPRPNGTWGFWEQFEPYVLNLQLAAEDLEVQEVKVDSATLALDWAAPELVVHKLEGRLYGGSVSGAASVSVPERMIEFSAVSDLDFHALDHKFTDRFRAWFKPYQWRGVPHAEVSGRVAWPDWNDLEPDWREEVSPTLGISGKFHVANPSYRGIPGLSASSHFHFTNLFWQLPDLTITRPEGNTVAAYEGDERTGDYIWNIVADIDPYALHPIFSDSQQRIFQQFTNHMTPHVEGVIRGRWRDHDRIGFEAQIAAPRVDIRGQALDDLHARVAYTNQTIALTDVTIIQGTNSGHADGLFIDFPGEVMHFTNVHSTLPPQGVANAIGPVTAEAVAPYQFTEPPRLHVDGRLGLEGHDLTDLTFDVDGGEFRWWKFRLDDIDGRLHWLQDRLTLTNLTSRFYDGHAAGHAQFQFYEDRPAEFSFSTVIENAQLHPLVIDVFSKTNQLDGLLSGELVVEQARSESLDTWNGHGQINLKNGLIWDIPIFAIFSPLFNALSPGLGQSRAEEAGADFTMINGTLISRNFMMRSTEISMLYQGTVDYEGNIDAVMEARVLRDSGALGPLISTAFIPLSKLFEYRLGGTLTEPVAEPVFIPKILMIVLEPFKVLGGILKPKPAGEAAP